MVHSKDRYLEVSRSIEAWNARCTNDPASDITFTSDDFVLLKSTVYFVAKLSKQIDELDHEAFDDNWRMMKIIF